MLRIGFIKSLIFFGFYLSICLGKAQNWYDYKVQLISTVEPYKSIVNYPNSYSLYDSISIDTNFLLTLSQNIQWGKYYFDGIGLNSKSLSLFFYQNSNLTINNIGILNNYVKSTRPLFACDTIINGDHLIFVEMVDFVHDDFYTDTVNIQLKLNLNQGIIDFHFGKTKVSNWDNYGIDDKLIVALLSNTSDTALIANSHYFFGNDFLNLKDTILPLFPPISDMSIFNIVQPPFESLKLSFSTTVKTTSSSVLKNKSSIIFSPNPTNGNIYFNPNLGELKRVEIYSIMGDLKFENKTIENVSFLDSGIYIIKMTNLKNETFQSYLIKQ